MVILKNKVSIYDKSAKLTPIQNIESDNLLILNPIVSKYDQVVEYLAGKYDSEKYFNNYTNNSAIYHINTKKDYENTINLLVKHEIYHISVIGSGGLNFVPFTFFEITIF